MNMNADSRKYIQLSNGEYLSKGGQAWIRRNKRKFRKACNRMLEQHIKWQPGTLEYRLAN